MLRTERIYPELWCDVKEEEQKEVRLLLKHMIIQVHTYNFFKDIFDRNSIDTRGMKLDSTVHYGEDYNNAFWNGTQMVYGDGDGDIFQRFTKSIDVIGHELTHGVTQYEAALEYEGQAGALNESFSDVFGSLVKQYFLKQKVEKADWLIGNGLFTRKVNGIALRSMKEPGTAYDDPTIGKDPQPGHMKDYVKQQVIMEGYILIPESQIVHFI